MKYYSKTCEGAMNSFPLQSYLPEHKKHCVYNSSETVKDIETVVGPKHSVTHCGGLLHLGRRDPTTFYRSYFPFYI